MPQFSLSKFGENLPVTGITAASQAALGLGLGLLFGKKMHRSTRERVAIACIGLGVLTLIPTVAGIIDRVASRSTSQRRIQRRLDSIRGDTGFSGTEL